MFLLTSCANNAREFSISQLPCADTFRGPGGNVKGLGRSDYFVVDYENLDQDVIKLLDEYSVSRLRNLQDERLASKSLIFLRSSSKLKKVHNCETFESYEVTKLSSHELVATYFRDSSWRDVRRSVFKGDPQFPIDSILQIQ